MAGGIDFGKQIGPLPLGAWLGAGAAGIALAYAVNRRNKPATVAAKDAAVTATDPTQAAGGESAGLGGGIGVGGVVGLPNGAGGGNQPAGGGAVSSTLTPTFTDNDAWGAYVTSLLVAKGYGGLAVAQALSDFQGGVQLDRTEAAIIDLAIRMAGPPPIAVPPITVAPAPTATAPSASAPGTAGVAVRANYRDGALHTFYTSPGATLPGYGGMPAGDHLWHEWVFADGVPHLQDLTTVLHLGPIQRVPPIVNTGTDGFLHVDVIGTDGKHNDIYWTGRAWMQRVLT